ncbi:catalase-like domain-containing protein [Coprinopsis sp. MPI-PUGE-AT-0042]|nr:catalase-like domain-containing protein [Coprinopsis sp. MPI-PUGE-AT-0042]
MKSIFYGALVNALLVSAACPFMDSGSSLEKRQEPSPAGERLPGDDGFLDEFVVDDSDVYATTDFGTPVNDRTSLKAGRRGPTLLEDFVLRTKITRFDHERIPERVVHARGAGAHGYFESYQDWSNITAAGFLGKAGEQTPVFLRFSTVAGSRGSADVVRDVHGFSLRFYTDEGNYDIVGNNVPVFFIQDAMQFPDLVHAVKPRPDKEMPQAGTAHDTAWDFFSRNPSTMHTLMWALSGHGIPRSYRHMDGFGVHTFRFVTDEGKSKLVKFHFTSKQGKASLIWPEAQALNGKNPDFHRQDLWDAIEDGNYPEWEMGVQVMEEEDVLKWGIDLLDPTKIVPVEYVPITPLGKLVLNRNVRNYFAETEQSMFCPGHVVRGIDFSDDPLLQGRLFSYVDTQLSRNMGSPNFEQIPINRPRSPVHNNNRDGAGQQMIHSNIYAYGENTLNNGAPQPANQTHGNGFFTAPSRQMDTAFLREVSPTFTDFWSQPRMFWNSLPATEQQMIVNAARFELSNVQSAAVRRNSLIQFNRISNEFANRVAAGLGAQALEPDATYYNENKTANVATFDQGPLPSVVGFKRFKEKGMKSVIVAEILVEGVDATYSTSDAVLFDAVVAVDATQEMFEKGSSLYPTGRPAQILRDAFNYGKPVGAAGSGKAGFDSSVVSKAGSDEAEAGVYIVDDMAELTGQIEEGLKTFKFTSRYPLDS